ncbi:hypothetical protein RHOM_12190 [Roseburia hominis A2-183]|uniref:Uncharacterized protein n=2 Tax=Roseburia hominis TaxID=301301 RepID=G2T558_ROSHA|nr:hypothetical protein [Roseburia hominis]AEN97546.1 hypothetical protein RHOM_12190 [Roseburia hominis A2-183]MDU6920078.1 hypothetical protein [Roseburia hominis]
MTFRHMLFEHAMKFGKQLHQAAWFRWRHLLSCRNRELSVEYSLHPI